MKKLTMLLLMIFLSNGCQTVIEQKLICAQINKYKIELVPTCDISVEFDRCRCRCMNLNTFEPAKNLKMCKWPKNFSGKVPDGFKTYSFPLEMCEGIAGQFVEDVAVKIRPNVKALNEVKNNLCD